MDFREFASKETAAFIERLTAAAAAQAEDARQHARDEAQRTIDAVRRELKEQSARSEKLDATLNDLRGQAATLQSKLKTLEAAVEQETRAKAAAEGELQKLRKAEAEHQRVRHELEAKVESSVSTEKALQQKLEESQHTIKTRGQELDKTRQELETVRHEIDDVRAEADAAVQAAALREQMTRSAPQPLDRLLTIFDQLAKASTIGDILTALVQGLATEFSRVAAFSLGGNHLEGLYQVGFDFKSDISKVVIPMTMDSLLTQAATSGRVHGFVGAELTESSCAPFGGTPAFVLTLPVAARGETVAVIYADTGDQQPSSGAAQRGVKFAELLLWHAVPMMAKLSVNQESIAELRRYATTLLNEAENMYDADVSEGMRAEALNTRLKDNLDCARRLYAQRVVADELPAAPSFDEQLAEVIDAKAGTPFGRDLSGVAGSPRPASRRGNRRRAEAS